MTGAAAGTALGAGAWALVQLLPEEQLMSWGWRLVFLSSAFVTIAAYILRRKLKETPVFAEIKERTRGEPRRSGRCSGTARRRSSWSA